MPTWGGVRARLRALVRRDIAERELDEEIAFHIDRETEKRVRLGTPRDEARRQALAAFGGTAQTREAHRDVRNVRWASELARDCRYAWRGLARSRLVSVTAI